jgi:hypothetical protein
LAQRLIEMMCPLRVCTVCGEPSRRIVGQAEYQRSANTNTRGNGRGVTDTDVYAMQSRGERGQGFTSDGGVTRVAPTLGWTDCGHNQWRTGMVLDPFSGSGTTLAVAQGCGRDATGIELYPHNADLIADRCGMFLEIDGGDDAAA